MSARCHLCGSEDVSPKSRMGSPVCDDCLPIQGHVVSMQNAPDGGSLAVCQCGWRSKVRRELLGTVQETKVRLHWRDVIRRAIDDFDALHGDGAAVRDLALGFVACAALAVNFVGFAAVLGAGS